MYKQLDETRNATWRLFLTTYLKASEQIHKKLSAAQLPSLEWYDVLWELQSAPEHRLRLSELAEQVLLSRSNLTRLLDRLEKENLLRREPCPSDRRGTYAVLTEAGSAKQKQMWGIYSACIAQYLGALDDEEVKVMQQALKKITASVAFDQ